jgi:DNA repair protein RecN (Recombination protein N)
VTQLLGAAVRTLTQQHGADPELDSLSSRLADLAALAADLGTEFGGYAERLDADPARLEQVEARRAELNSLLRKYCDDPDPSIEAVLRWAAAARERLGQIDVSDEAIAALRASHEQAGAEVAKLAEEVSRQRHQAAERLAAAVSAELAGLAMPDARLHVSVAVRPPTAGLPSVEINGREVAVTTDGVDEVNLLLEPHPGAPALPIGRGASGGELSRVMLALEVCLAGTDPVPTLVFDEVDAGVGGRAAVEVGRRLARLARQRQVLVVTHLAQVAAYADRHLVVDKPAAGAEGGVTASDVRLVEGDARVAELARMLAGSHTATARDHAAELLAEAADDRAAAADNGARPSRKAARKAG